MRSEQRQECERMIERSILGIRLIHVMGKLSIDYLVVRIEMEKIIKLGEVFGKEVNDDEARSILENKKNKKEGFFDQLLNTVIGASIRGEMQSIGWKIALLFDKM